MIYVSLASLFQHGIFLLTYVLVAVLERLDYGMKNISMNLKCLVSFLLDKNTMGVVIVFQH